MDRDLVRCVCQEAAANWMAVELPKHKICVTDYSLKHDSRYCSTYTERSVLT
jgi:hypothetical protein